MPKRIVYTRPDGGVSVVTPVRPPRKGETEEDYLTTIQALVVPRDAAGVHVVEEDQMPTDHAYYDAWVSDGTQVTVDATLAAAVDARAAEIARRTAARGPDLSLPIRQLVGALAAPRPPAPILEEGGK